MRKFFPLIAVVCLVAACGGSTDQSDQQVSDEDAGTSADADQQPEIYFPEVKGLTEVEDENPDPNIVEVTLRAQEKTVELADGFEVDMYTYNGQFPGPLIQAKVGDRVIVHFENELPEATTIHWHGLRISDEMDGSPRIQQPVGPGESFDYDFVVPEAGSYWYHPHVRSNEQIEKGLYGAFIIRDEKDPRYDAERYFTIDDILVTSDGELPPFLSRHPEIMHGRTGNALLTNGTLDEITVRAAQGAVERWRLVNPANARTMTLTLEGASWRVIGTDGGLLPEPYETDRLVLPVGQRFDVEVTYDQPGRAILNSMVRVRDDQGQIVEEAFPLVKVLISAVDRQPRQVEWPDITLPEREPTRDEVIEFDARQGATGVEWTLNDTADAAEPLFTFTEGDTVRMRLKNLAGPEHPFHLHGQFFTVVDDGRPWTNQPGLKDTVLVPGMDEVEIIAYLDNPGQWMAHCHILEHAELGMMSEIIVEPAQ